MGRALIHSAGGVGEFFFFSLQRVTPGHGCCLGEEIYSPVGAVPWSLQHPLLHFQVRTMQSLFPSGWNQGFPYPYLGIKTPALEKPLQLLLGIPPHSPVMEGGQCTVSHSLEPKWPMRSGQAEQVTESSQEWGMGGSSSFPGGTSCPCSVPDRTFVVLTSFTREELKAFEERFVQQTVNKKPLMT